jgi:hypothetical protein
MVTGKLYLNIVQSKAESKKQQGRPKKAAPAMRLSIVQVICSICRAFRY